VRVSALNLAEEKMKNAAVVLLEKDIKQLKIESQQLTVENDGLNKEVMHVK
jgi:hypothetical protein